MSTDRERVEALAKVLEEAFMGRSRDRIAYALAEGRAEKAIDAVLASDWLRDLLAEAKADAWDEGHAIHGPIREFGETPCSDFNPYRENRGDA